MASKSKKAPRARRHEPGALTGARSGPRAVSVPSPEAGSIGGEPRPVPKRAVYAQAERFKRTRQDHSAEIAEDYVELIAELIRVGGEARTVDIARRLGVSHVTVTKTVARLRRAGLIRSEPYRSIFLTELGEQLARRVQDRHALVVRLLLRMGVDRATAEGDAEGMEHHLSEATIEAIRRFLASPNVQA